MAGLMDELGKAVSRVQEGAKEFLDKTDIDEKIVGAAKDLKGKAQELLDKTDIDEKIVGAAKDIKDKAQEALDKARPGMEDAFGKAQAGVKSLLDQSMEKLQDVKPKDAMEQIKDDVKTQVDAIRGAVTGTDPIHDYFNRKAEEAAEAAEAAPAPAPVEEAPAEAPEAPAEAPEAPVDAPEEPAYDEDDSDAME